MNFSLRTFVSAPEPLIREIDITELPGLRAEIPLIDVRSPSEFAHGHIPGARNLPLFDDAERARIGTLYKEKGPEEAMYCGLSIAAPKSEGFIRWVRDAGNAGDISRGIALHCWRGGMRSRSMAALFELSGIPVFLLRGGYKSYRNLAKHYFAKPWKLLVLAGKTGSAKTEMLRALHQAGAQVVDLEQLACHKGSAFGHLGEAAQPHTEQFENRLFEALYGMDEGEIIWVEDESMMIGTVCIDTDFWKAMQSAPCIDLQLPMEERVHFLQNTYGAYDSKALEAALSKIRKKLGGQHYLTALHAFRIGDPATAIRTVLIYYDKSYAYAVSRRNPALVFPFSLTRIDPKENAAALIAFAAKISRENEVTANGFTIEKSLPIQGS